MRRTRKDTAARETRRAGRGSSLALGLALALAAAAAGCGGGNHYAPPPPPKVQVATPVQRDVTVYETFTGRFSASETVEIRARVPGYLRKVHFRDGQPVKKDQLLFTIDSRAYDAAVHGAEADLLAARAALKFAENELARREDAWHENAVSELDYLRAAAERDKARAAVAAAEAHLEAARLDRSFTEVRSPIDGVIDRALVHEGNLVGQGQPTVLAVVRRIDPMDFYFSLDERSLVRLKQELQAAAEAGRAASDEGPPIHLALAGEDEFAREGRVTWMDTAVDRETGTIRVRATLANPDGILVDGAFARGRVPVRVLEDALLVPEVALGVDQVGSYVYVVGDDGKVARRDVRTGPRDGTLRVISAGIEPGDRVVVRGLARVRPGIEVEVEDAESAGKTPGATPAGEAR